VTGQLLGEETAPRGPEAFASPLPTMPGSGVFGSGPGGKIAAGLPVLL